MMHLLESESIEIIREVVATAIRPVMMYSVGKDSSVMLHLARKAFYPGSIPFPLLHIDTGWKFKAMYEHREKMVSDLGLKLIVYQNPEGIAAGVNPWSHGSNYHTDVMKTQALTQALEKYQFDMVMGGARRDEERSRAKERIFSFRERGHRWDPKRQRPELWSLYNTRIHADETIRVFPISNWTELDIWRYIEAESIPVVPLYFAAERPVVRRGGQWIMVDDDRFPFLPSENPERRKVRFRTLGCWPLTAAIESQAQTLQDVIAETFESRFSERQGRLIDNDAPSSMEKKKAEGYF